MRILAIRGCNLASLAGEFDIDFRAEPLQSAGLFAISGPTGAGKSTLLDALCLALYEATPRLVRAGARGIALPDVRDETVTPQDARNLLRRGAAEGHAEVDFVGSDGKTYRSRWSVRRARSRVDGRLQESEMRLWRLPELQPLGGKNVEVKAEIVRRVGLNFEQFTRAVLLAQNEFSAFLKANDNERGELLETLTGSAVYSEISRLAFERAREEGAALQRLSERLAHALPLSDDERMRLETDAAAAQARLAELESRLAALERQLAWEREARVLDTAHLEAVVTRDGRRAECAAANERRSRLAESEAVQPARALLAESRRLALEIERCRAAIADCEQRLERSAQAQREAEHARDESTQRLRAIEAEHARQLALLAQARTLDARLDALRPEHERSRRRAQDADAAARDAGAARDAKSREQAALAAQRAERDAWLAAHAADASLAAQWQRCDILLSQAREQALQARDAAQAATVAQEAQRRGESEEQRHAAAGAAAAAELERRRAERDARAERLRMLDAQRIPGERARQAQEQQQLIEAERLCRALHDIQLRRTEALADLMRHAEALASAQRGWQKAQEEQPGLAAALAQAERSLRRAEAASGASVEQLRAALADGEPCPVCGASEHPYRLHDPRLTLLLDELAAEVAACRAASSRNTEAQATHKALADAALAAEREAERRAAEQDAALARTDQAWRAHALFESDPALAAPPHACAAWLAQRQAAIAARIGEIDAADAAFAAAAAERDAAQAALDAAAARIDECRAGLDAVRATSVEAARQLIAARERERDAHARLDASLDALEAMPLPRDWRAAWHADADALHARCRDSVVAWEAQEALRQADLARAAALEAEAQAAAERSVRAASEHALAAAALAEHDASLQALQRERNALFGGRPASQVEAELSARIAAAREALDAAAAALQSRALEVTRCTESRDRSRERLQELLAQAGEAGQRLDGWLAQHNARHACRLDRERLESLLAHDPEWMRTERESLAALDAALRDAEAICSERERRCAAHRALRDAVWPELAESALAENLGALRADRETAQNAHGTLRLALSGDDARRLQAAGMREQLERQEAVQRRWAQLSELIGSADGKKFRNYAQQTTLDVLLAYANRHLADLARRYRLERVRDTLALLVIDADMGEEVRSVHSLSGGESFLVSLALALGLASLSSNGVRVESLFIDEGFGSLDADTLRVAMDALDGLQALGRKVGVISHVQEMTERIATRILVRRVSAGSSQVSVKAH
jgi:exonuclease SbcC